MQSDIKKAILWCAYIFTLFTLSILVYYIVKCLNFNSWVIAFMCVVFSHQVIGGVLRIIKALEEYDGKEI